MALPKGRSKTELQRLYGQTKWFGNFNMHHLVPSTRQGGTNEFNLYPYRIKSHRAYHTLFLNMTIWEVWEALENIYEEIFNTDEERINRFWLRVCPAKQDGLEIQISRVFGIEYLQEKWISAFGGEDIKQAQRLLEYMMLFIIFGSHVVDTNYLFDNGNLTKFFEEYPANEDRLKAFNLCFGETAGLQRIKAKMSKILNRIS